MKHRGVDFEIKPLVPAEAGWRWIVLRYQPNGPMALGQVMGTMDDAIAACKREIDDTLDQT